MGIGIELADNQAVLKSHPRLTAESNGYKYVIERKDGISTYTVSDGAASLSLPIRYAFGVSSQTFVFEYNGHFYESLVSYYPNAGGLAITMSKPPSTKTSAKLITQSKETSSLPLKRRISVCNASTWLRR